MKNMLKVSVIALMASAVAVSCSRNDVLGPGSGEKGFLRLNISSDLTVTEVKAQEDDPTFKVVIKNYEICGYCLHSGQCEGYGDGLGECPNQFYGVLCDCVQRQ